MCFDRVPGWKLFAVVDVGSWIFINVTVGGVDWKDPHFGGRDNYKVSFFLHDVG